jgi:hypothetical protein
MDDFISEFVISCIIAPFLKELSSGAGKSLVDYLKGSVGGPGSKGGVVPFQFVTEFVFVYSGWLYVVDANSVSRNAVATRDGYIWHHRVMPTDAVRFGSIYRVPDGGFYLTDGSRCWKMPDKVTWAP